jgi:hypothetical protein
MKPSPISSSLTLIFTLSLSASLFAQGPLSPPATGGGTIGPDAAVDGSGNPQTNMKTLHQVEPRTDLSTVAGDATYEHIIDQPGSYYLSKNLDVTKTDGILINASGVTLDLNGFVIFRSSTAAAAGAAILLNDATQNITIINGHIVGGVTYDPEASGNQFSGSGFFWGIYQLFPTGEGEEPVITPPSHVLIEKLTVSGCRFQGIGLGPYNVTVRNCVVGVTGSTGISADLISHCVVTNAGGTGIAGTSVHNCQANSVGSTAISARIVTHSQGNTTSTSSFHEGINAIRAVSHSVGVSSGGDGISSSHVLNCYGSTNSTGNSAGIDGNYVKNSYGSCSGNGAGVAGNIISDSEGLSQSGWGIFSIYSVNNCAGFTWTGSAGIWSVNGNVSHSVGETRSTGATHHGILAACTVSNSTGLSDGGDGINAKTVTNSYGESIGDDGIEATIITFSVGNSSGTGVGLRATTANSCHSESNGEVITNKYNMP